MVEVAREFIVNFITPYLPGYVVVALVVLIVGTRLLRSRAFGRLVWRRVHFSAHRRRMMVVSFAGLIAGGALAGGAIAWLSHRYYEGTANLIKNGGFEDGTLHWGTGYMEDGVRNGNWPNEIERLPYVVSPNPQQTISRGYHDSTTGHESRSSYRLAHQTESRAKHFGTISQRVVDLVKNRRYAVSFWTKASDGIAADALFVTTDYTWSNAQPVAPTKDWTPHVHYFNARDLDYADIRFVIQSPGTVWLDDVDVREAS